MAPSSLTRRIISERKEILKISRRRFSDTAPVTFDGIDNNIFCSYLVLDVVEIRNGDFRTKEDAV